VGPVGEVDPGVPGPGRPRRPRDLKPSQHQVGRG
jgi:hypothetical protein